MKIRLFNAAKLMMVLGAVLCASMLALAWSSDPSSVRANETGDGVLNWTNLNQTLVDIGTTNLTRLDIDGGRWLVTKNLTIPTNIVLYVYPGSLFDVSTNVTLTINGTLIAGPYSIKAGSGIVTGAPIAAQNFSQWGCTFNDVNITGRFQSVYSSYINSTSNDFVDIVSEGYNLRPQGSTTITFTNGSSAATMQAQIDGVRRYIPAWNSVYFQFEDGVYDLDTYLRWIGFYGGGAIRVRGNLADAYTAGFTNQSVVLRYATNQGFALWFEDLSVNPLITSLKTYMNTDTGLWNTNLPTAMYFSDTSMAYIRYCAFDGTSTNTGSGPFATDGAYVSMYSNTLGGIRFGCSALAGGWINSKDNYSSSSTPPAYAGAARGGIIIFTDNVPTGIVSTVFTNNGGVSRQ